MTKKINQKKGKAEAKPSSDTDNLIQDPEYSELDIDGSGSEDQGYSDEVDTEARDEAEQKLIVKNRDELVEVKDMLSEATDETVVYRAKHKGLNLALPTGFIQDVLRNGQINRIAEKKIIVFKQNLYATEDQVIIELLDKQIAKWQRRGESPLCQRLEDWKRLHTPVYRKSEDELLQDVPFEVLQAKYLERLNSQQDVKIKRGNITTQ